MFELVIRIAMESPKQLEARPQEAARRRGGPAPRNTQRIIREFAPVVRAVSEIGIVLSDSGHLACVFSNLAGLFFEIKIAIWPREAPQFVLPVRAGDIVRPLLVPRRNRSPFPSAILDRTFLPFHTFFF